MFSLGFMYANGEGVEAYAWLNVAAAKGQKEAAESLGLMGHRSCKGIDVAVIRRDK